MSSPVAVDASWLRSDPSEMMGHACPKTFNELLHSARPVWKRLYRDWFPSNISSALPDWKDAEARAAFDIAFDQAKLGDKNFDGHRKAFEAHYKDSFYEDIEAIKKQLHDLADARPKGQSEKQAFQQAGNTLAKDAVKKKVKAAAGAVSAPEVVLVWSQVTAFKEEQHRQYAEALQKFTAAKWDGSFKTEAISGLDSAITQVRSAEGALRDLVVVIQANKGNVPKSIDDELLELLINWANGVDGLSRAVANAGQLVVDWAEANAAKIMKEDFDAAFPLIGGALLAARLCVGAAGAALAFFPKLSPIATGLSLADSVLEYATKRLVVIVESKQPELMVKYAGTKFELPDDYFESTMGKAYKAKEDVKKKIQEGVDAIKAQLGKIADAGTAFTASVLESVVGKEKMDELRKLKAQIQEKIDAAAESDVVADALFIKDCLLQVAQILGYDVEEPTMGGIIKDFLFDGLKAVAPTLAAELVRLVPIIGTITFIMDAAGDVMEYHASIHKKLVTADGYTEETKAEVQILVSDSIKKSGPIMRALDFDSVQFDGLDENGNYKVTVAQIQGVFNHKTMRFSPSDRSRMQAAVTEAAKKNHPGGEFKQGENTFVINWESFVLGDGKAGEYSASANARRTADKNGPFDAGDDGRDWHVDLWADSAGGASVRDKHLLDGKGQETNRPGLFKMNAMYDDAALAKAKAQPATSIGQLGALLGSS